MAVDEVTSWALTAAGNPSPLPHGPEGLRQQRIGLSMQEMMSAIARWRDSLSAIQTLANSATPSVAGGKIWLTGGTITITDFTGGAKGQEIVILSEHAITITDGTNIFLNASGNFVMADTDSLYLVQKADGNWYEISRSVN